MSESSSVVAPPDVCLGVIPESEERLLDALAIESACVGINRPTALMQVNSLVERIRRDAKALKRMEISKVKMEAGTVALLPESAVTVPPCKDVQLAHVKDLSLVDTTDKKQNTVIVSSRNLSKYSSIDRFAFDAGSYNSPTVTLYVNLPGVGAIDTTNISCDFKKTSFDLIVNSLNDTNYRLFRNNLFKDINPEKSKYIVKKDKIVVKLAKVKAEYGSYDNWTELSNKKKKTGNSNSSSSSNPTDGIMDLMKDMYDSGDDKMKKMIGETMLKQRTGELGKDPASGMPGMDNLDM